MQFSKYAFEFLNEEIRITESCNTDGARGEMIHGVNTVK